MTPAIWICLGNTLEISYRLDICTPPMLYPKYVISYQNTDKETKLQLEK